MNESLDKKIKCPHCGHLNDMTPSASPSIALCDVDDGGCDRRFIYTLRSHVIWSSKTGLSVDDFDPQVLAERNCAAMAAAWREKWPGHCKACHGWGGKSFTERHGFKGGGGEQMFDECQAIEDARVCHRCGCLGLDVAGEGPCSACGWNYDDGEPTL
jgi:hypothetical protein